MAGSPEGILTLAGTRFKPTRTLGQDGMDQLVARDEFNREVALKESMPHFSDQQEVQARLMLEAEVMATMEHPSIVPVYGLGLAPAGSPFSP